MGNCLSNCFSNKNNKNDQLDPFLPLPSRSYLSEAHFQRGFQEQPQTSLGGGGDASSASHSQHIGGVRHVVRRQAQQMVEPTEDEYKEHIRNKARPLCFFRDRCARKSEEHKSQFSHDPQNHNGTTGSKEECCKNYPQENGGHAGPARLPNFRVNVSVMKIGQLMIKECQEMIDKLVKNAGIAFLTSDGYLVMVWERGSNKLNFPCGKRERDESIIDAAVREMIEEFGKFNPFDGQPGVSHMITVVRNHTSTRTGSRSQSVIYVFSHPQPAAWFKANFKPNDECYAIAFMSIPEFREIVTDQQRCQMFRYPSSMMEIQRQIDAFFLNK